MHPRATSHASGTAARLSVDLLASQIASRGRAVGNSGGRFLDGWRLERCGAPLTTNLPPACSISFRPVPGAARSTPVFSTIRPTTINGKDHIMTLEQSIDLAELQADMAFEAYLAAFDEDAHPETLDSLETEALIARSRYDDLRNQGLGH